MNASSYLRSYGWQEGEALKKGGLKKPILVKHKKDTKGLGSEGNDSDMWWERLFDGQLKSLEVTSGENGVSINQNEQEVADHMRKANLPLYRMFVRGEGLAGTVGKTENAHVKSIRIEAAEVIDNVEKSIKEKVSETRKHKKKKGESMGKKERKERKEKKEKKEKKKKEDKKEKKSKSDKKCMGGKMKVAETEDVEDKKARKKREHSDTDKKSDSKKKRHATDVIESSKKSKKSRKS